MITRSLNRRLEGHVPLTIRGPASQAEIEFLVDTGFNGFVSMSSDQVAKLDLEWSRYQTAALADAEEFLVGLYEAEAFWDGGWRTIEVAALGATCLLGMQMLRGYSLTIDVIENGTLTITRLDR
jgi:clan AA aspartic protease